MSSDGGTPAAAAAAAAAAPVSREEATAFLRNLQLSVGDLQRRVDAALRAVAATPPGGAPAALAAARAGFAAWAAEQGRDWDSLLLSGGGAPSPPGPPGVRLGDARLAAMGAVPAMGGGATLPWPTPEARAALRPTPAGGGARRAAAGPAPSPAVSELQAALARRLEIGGGGGEG
jgi:hypothetical protein